MWAFGFDDSRSLADASAIALFWSWYNIVILTLACFVCIEASQARRGDRFQSKGMATLTVAGAQRQLPIGNISVSGMRLHGAAPAEIGTRVRVQFDGIDVEANIMRVDAAGFGVQFAPSQEMHARLVRHIYCDRPGTNQPDINAGKVAGAVFNRVFR